MNVRGFLAAVGLSLTAISSQASVIFSESFESPINTMDWQVYQTFGSWTSTSGEGIEVQTSGTVVNAHSGNQYVELDSDSSRGGIVANTSNSSMTRTLFLQEGVYLLEWFYLPRTNTPNDNGIAVYLDGTSETRKTNQLMAVSSTRNAMSNWVYESMQFYVDGNDHFYDLTFAATGIANNLGGFIDDIKVTSIPEPTSVALMATGLLAAGLSSRRRKR